MTRTPVGRSLDDILVIALRQVELSPFDASDVDPMRSYTGRSLQLGYSSLHVSMHSISDVLEVRMKVDSRL